MRTSHGARPKPSAGRALPGSLGQGMAVCGDVVLLCLWQCRWQCVVWLAGFERGEGLYGWRGSLLWLAGRMLAGSKLAEPTASRTHVSDSEGGAGRGSVSDWELCVSCISVGVYLLE